MSSSPLGLDPLLSLLDSERARFLAEVARVPAARVDVRPVADRWSVAEIVEHVARIDRGIEKLITMRNAEPRPATPGELAQAELTPEKVALVRDRTARIEAPERVRPSGSLTLGAALEQLTAARDALKAAYVAADDEVLDSNVHPHPILGFLTLRAWMQLVAHHDWRHGQQVAEIADSDGKQNAGSPASIKA